MLSPPRPNLSFKKTNRAPLSDQLEITLFEAKTCLSRKLPCPSKNIFPPFSLSDQHYFPLPSLLCQIKKKNSPPLGQNFFYKPWTCSPVHRSAYRRPNHHGDGQFPPATRLQQLALRSCPRPAIPQRWREKG